MHWKFPFTIMPNLVDKAYASSIECVVNITVAFFFYVATLEITFHINLLALGSIPVEGSSKNIIRGFPIIAIATDNFLLFPPERVPEILLAYLTRSSYSILCLIAASLWHRERDFIS